MQPFQGIEPHLTKAIPYQIPPNTSSWLEHHIEWLLDQENCMHTAAYSIEKGVSYLLSFIGVPLYSLITQHENSLIGTKRFEHLTADIHPPEESEIVIETKKTTFNHVNDFIIHNTLIWYKPIQSDEWQPCYFDGIPHGLIPKEICTDGANLIVLNHNREVHYKKILKEERDKGEAVYCYADKTHKDNWKPKWFTLPYVHWLISDSRLKIPKHVRAWAISHRGVLTHSIKDRAGNDHPDHLGVTTLFTLSEDGRTIKLEDPWQPMWTNLTIPLPETSQTTYEAINMKVAGSTLMLIGYNYIIDENGTATKTLQLYTSPIDIDILGWNPFFYTYGYSVKHHEPGTFILPVFHYREQPLPKLTGRAELTDGITILQTGEGMEEREMRIVGKNSNGEVGLYFKALNDVQWNFQLLSQTIHDTDINPLSHTEEIVEDFPTPRVSNWTGDICGYQVTLKDFNSDSIMGSLSFRNEDHEFECLLYKRINLVLRTLTSMDHSHFDLALPDELEIDELPANFRDAFNGNRHISIDLSEEQEILKLSHGKWHSSVFDIELSREGRS